ncbi:MAG: hypothetical protein K9G44_05740 [Melioribacteraceae bacterium]|nr:hypothetical protein [Melioribacteraceae bacterium]
MFENDEKYFKIVSFSNQNGASYYSSKSMNPDLFAYAGLSVNMMDFKIVNHTNEKVELNFVTDQYYIVDNEGIEYFFSKGNSYDYPNEKEIHPNESVEISLELPSDFWKNVGMNDSQATTKNLITEFWKGNNELNLVKSNIAKIVIRLENFTTIILKPIFTETETKGNK